MFTHDDLRAFLACTGAYAVVRIIEAKGSTPRERGTIMLVSPTEILGSVGGGRLEFVAIARARELLAQGGVPVTLAIPLGPEISQCCGGHVTLQIASATPDTTATLLAEAAHADATAPSVYIFGAGHIGIALSSILAITPVRVALIDTRDDVFAGVPARVDIHQSALPEQIVREAAPGAAFVIVTHDHSLDFLIAAEALRRTDAAYVGMIGSRTKRQTFKSWFLKEAGGDIPTYERLVSPIGRGVVQDKRPAVIAALVAAEVLTALDSASRT